MDIFIVWNRTWKLVGILWTWMGWILVLGPSWKCFATSLVNIVSSATYYYYINKKKSLQNWTLFLSIITFLLSLLGTFLVRSGVLVSVHAFANDPKRGVFILLLLLAISAISFILFLKRSKTFSNKLQINLVSREGAISLNNIFMFTLTFTILLGTVYPLFSNVIFNNKISVGAPFLILFFPL